MAIMFESPRTFTLELNETELKVISSLLAHVRLGYNNKFTEAAGDLCVELDCLEHTDGVSVTTEYNESEGYVINLTDADDEFDSIEEDFNLPNDTEVETPSVTCSQCKRSLDELNSMWFAGSPSTQYPYATYYA